MPQLEQDQKRSDRSANLEFPTTTIMPRTVTVVSATVVRAI
jgi:hypothetical protein